MKVLAIGVVVGWTGSVSISEDKSGGETSAAFDYRYHLATDTRRIREELGFVEPVGRMEGLRRAVAWEQGHAGDTD